MYRSELNDVRDRCGIRGTFHQRFMSPNCRQIASLMKLTLMSTLIGKIMIHKSYNFAHATTALLSFFTKVWPKIENQYLYITVKCNYQRLGLYARNFCDIGHSVKMALLHTGMLSEKCLSLPTTHLYNGTHGSDAVVCYLLFYNILIFVPWPKLAMEIENEAIVIFHCMITSWHGGTFRINAELRRFLCGELNKQLTSCRWFETPFITLMNLASL